MSEDVDLVVPGAAASAKRANALQMDAIRAALQQVAPVAGLRVKFPHGERSDRDAHARWELPYDSVFGEQFILVEATIRPVLLPVRRAPLRQFLPMVESAGAYCWALDDREARAEKVRAAFTRREPRDYYDLQLLASAGKDLSSPEFLSVVDRKLAELGAVPLAKQPAAFGISDSERANFDRLARAELATVVRVDDPTVRSRRDDRALRRAVGQGVARRPRGGSHPGYIECRRLRSADPRSRLHGGIVLLEDGNLLRDEQQRVIRHAIELIAAQYGHGNDMVNRLLRIWLAGTWSFESSP